MRPPSSYLSPASPSRRLFTVRYQHPETLQSKYPQSTLHLLLLVSHNPRLHPPVLLLDTVHLLEAELARVPPLALEVGPESGVFVLDGVLANVGDEEQDQGSAQKTQTAGDVEGVLGGGGIGVASCFDVREDVGLDDWGKREVSLYGNKLMWNLVL